MWRIRSICCTIRPSSSPPLTKRRPLTDPARADKAHIRIGNRLYEAILDSSMSDRQKVICHGLLRVTLGWRQASATITQDELAEASGMIRSGERAGGTFRHALAELRAEGVVTTIDHGEGKPKSYALNQDFTAWGRFSVAPQRLRRLFGQRFGSADEGMSQPARSQAESEDGVDRGQASTWPLDRPTPGLSTGQPTPLNPLRTIALDLRKDIERQESTDIETLQNGESGPKAPLSDPVPTGLHARRVAHTTLEAQYDSERANAARAWADDPSNAADLARIDAEARNSIGLLKIDSYVGRRAYEAERTRLIALRIGFPSPAAWRGNRSE